MSPRGSSCSAPAPSPGPRAPASLIDESPTATAVVQRQQVEQPLDLCRRDRVAVVVVTMGNCTEFLVVHGRAPSCRSGSFHGATRKSSAIPGSASLSLIHISEPT